jgi:outer membrane protein, heavy metal efflux system
VKSSVKSLFLILACIFILQIPGFLSAQEPQSKPLNINQIIEEALNKNPDVLAAKSRWEVLKERPLQAGSLDDPTVGLAILNLPTDSFNFRDEDMTMKEISVTQRLPFPGKRGLRTEIAQKEAEAAFHDYEEAKNKVSRDIKVAYYELFYVNKAIEVTEKNRELLKLFNKIAETKYSVGEGIQLDVLKSQVEVSKMIDELIMLSQNKRLWKSKINILLYRPPFSPLGDPEEVKFERFSASPDVLQAAAVANRPLLQSMKRSIEKNQVGLKMAEKDYYPDFDLKLAYGQRDEGPMGKRSDLVSAMVTFNIPLWYKNKQGKKVVETQREIQATHDQLAALTSEITFTISEKLTEMERFEKQIELLKTGIIPQAAFSLDSAINAYRVNKVDFMALLDNLTTLFKYEIQYYRLLTDHRKNISEMESAVGKSSAGEKKE